MFKTIVFWLLAGVGAAGTVGIALTVPSTVAEESSEPFHEAAEAILTDADESAPVQ